MCFFSINAAFFFLGFHLTMFPVIDIDDVYKRNNIKLKANCFADSEQDEMHNFLRIKFIQI